MDAYRFLCDLRQRGITLRVDGAELRGRWIGGRLLASPAETLTDADRTGLRPHARAIRRLLLLVERLLEWTHEVQAVFGESTKLVKVVPDPGGTRRRRPRGLKLLLSILNGAGIHQRAEASRRGTPRPPCFLAD
jgi:hypothetical protein